MIPPEVAKRQEAIRLDARGYTPETIARTLDVPPTLISAWLKQRVRK